MAAHYNISAWIALFMGLYALAAGIGELRAPGGWTKMLRDLVQGHGLRFVTGIICIFGGAAIYLVNPWVSGDWLAMLISVIGGLMVAEGLLILAAGDRFIAMAGLIIGKGGAPWAGASALIGVALIFAGIARL